MMVKNKNINKIILKNNIFC